LRAFKATTPPAADTELYLSKSLTSAHMWLSIVKQDLESDMSVKVFVPV
jgi:hypothetical protein